MIVIGNGESRASIDIDKLAGPKVGCNAIMRDYRVDHLVCVDRRMVQEAISAGVNTQGTFIYTRQDWYSNFKTLRVRTVPELPYVGSDRHDDPFHWGSGPYAVLLAAKLSKKSNVDLIGFDLHSKTQTVNNIYKSTPNYDDASKRAVDPRYWIHQIGMVFKCFPKIQFKIYQDSDWASPKAWNHSNVMVDNISNLSYTSYT
jgi:hypothetical protein